MKKLATLLFLAALALTTAPSLTFAEDLGQQRIECLTLKNSTTLGNEAAGVSYAQKGCDQILFNFNTIRNVSDFGESVIGEADDAFDDIVSAANRCEVYKDIMNGGPRIMPIGDATERFNSSNCTELIQKANELRAATGKCGSFLLDAGCHLDRWWKGVVAGLLDLMWWVTSYLTNVFYWLARLLLLVSVVLMEVVMQFLVFNMGSFINYGTAVHDAWRILRDIANIILIGGFIMVGFSTILQVANYAANKLLVKLIISALLVNFSFFFTGALIDASNYLASEVYQSNVTQDFCESIDSTESNTGVTTNTSWQDSAACYLGLGIVNALNISTWSDIKEQAQRTSSESGENSNKMLTVLGLMGGIFALITGFILFSISLLLIGRFVALIILLITSPIGIAGRDLPFFNEWAKKWQNALIPQALFAPVFFVLFALSLTMIRGTGEVLHSVATGDSYASFASGNLGAAIGVMPIILHFAISIGFLYATLKITRGLSESGAAFMGIDKIYKGINDKLGGGYGALYQATIGGKVQWAQEKGSKLYDRTIGLVGSKIPVIKGVTGGIGMALTPSKKSKPFDARQTVEEQKKSAAAYVKQTKVPFFGGGKDNTEKTREIRSKSPDQIKDMSLKEIRENMEHFSQQQKDQISLRDDLTKEDRLLLATAHLSTNEKEGLNDVENRSMAEVSSILSKLSQTDLSLLMTARSELRVNKKILAALDDSKFNALTTDGMTYSSDTEVTEAKGIRKKLLTDTEIADDVRKVAVTNLGQGRLAGLSENEVKSIQKHLVASQTKYIYENTSDSTVVDYIKRDSKLKEHLVGPGDHSEAIAKSLSRIEASLTAPPPQTPPQPPQNP